MLETLYSKVTGDKRFLKSIFRNNFEVFQDIDFSTQRIALKLEKTTTINSAFQTLN